MNGKVLWGCVNMYVYIYVSIRIHCGTNFELKNVSTGTIRDEESLSQPAQKLRLEREVACGRACLRVQPQFWLLQCGSP